MRQALRHPGAWWVLLLIGLLPFAWLLGLTLQDQLGPNPTEYLTRATGDWTLRSLCVVVRWKYGYKRGKSLVKIRFTD